MSDLDCDCGLRRIIYSEIVRLGSEMETLLDSNEEEREGYIMCRQAILFELSDILANRAPSQKEEKK